MNPCISEMYSNQFLLGQIFLKYALATWLVVAEVPTVGCKLTLNGGLGQATSHYVWWSMECLSQVCHPLSPNFCD